MRSGRLRDFENSDQFLPIERIPKYEFVDDVELHPSSVGKAKTDEIVDYLNQLQAVFYKKGTVKFENFTLEVDKSCALMVTFIGNDYELWVSNPDHEKLVVNVKLNSGAITFNLEEGYLLNNLGRPLGYSNKSGFKNYKIVHLKYMLSTVCSLFLSKAVFFQV